MTHFLKRHQITASFLVHSGLARLSRVTRQDEACILTFHGLQAKKSASAWLDESLYAPVSFFRNLCHHLAENYSILPLSDIVEKISRGAPLPDRTVAITFDDGYESNHQLAFPVLREYNLPATVFICTGFVDGAIQPWFNQIEMTVANATANSIDLRVGDKLVQSRLDTTAGKTHALGSLLAAFKLLPQDQVGNHLHAVTSALRAKTTATPAHLRPMNWAQVREMHQSGLITIGAHTHTHPILGRCTADVAREEIFQSRDRIAHELGSTPALFSYPNGLDEDFHEGTKKLLQEAGFKAAFTMMPGLAHTGRDAYDLPRYGTPETLQEAEATVSGAMENFKSWRRKFRNAFAL